MGTYRSGATMTQIQMTEWEWPREPRFLMCTPLSHAGAAFFVPVLLLGGSLVVVPYFEPGLVLETIERERITATMLVPTMLYTLMDHPDFATRDLSSLETVYYGAAAMSPARLREAITKLGPIFFQYYGQAEGPMTICVLRKDEHDVDDLARLATCGRPVPWVHVKLLDDAGEEVPRGEPGEICVRGPLVMRGYWNKPEQTAEALAGGWLHTGDIAREDEDGFYTIVDRKKDMVVTGGFNVFPREVEDVISAHPAVANVAVIGVPDERWGEAVKAVVVLRPGESVEAERADRGGQGGQGVGPGPQDGRLRRRDPRQPAGQARQEGAAGPLLAGHRPPGGLNPRVCRLSPRISAVRDARRVESPGGGHAPVQGEGHVRRRRVLQRPGQRAVQQAQVGGGADRDPAALAARVLGRGQEQGQRPLRGHGLPHAERGALRRPPLDGGGDGPPRVGVAERGVGAAADGDARLDQAAARVQVGQVAGVDLEQVAVAPLQHEARLRDHGQAEGRHPPPQVRRHDRPVLDPVAAGGAGLVPGGERRGQARAGHAVDGDGPPGLVGGR